MTTTDIDTGTEKMLAHVEDGIGWMTYNNPARLNAMSCDMQLAVPRILAAFRDDPDVRVIVVHGCRATARSCRAPTSPSSASSARRSMPAPTTTRAMADAWRVWRELDKPIIAMIRGYCIGGGLLTAMRADIRIAAEDSQFGVPAARLGLGYAFGGVEELVALVGPSWAAEILFSARRLSADEALRIGLVNRVVPVDELEAQVRDARARDRGERAAHGAGVQGRDPRGAACRRQTATRARVDAAGRGVLPLRGLPRGASRVPREARPRFRGV